MHQAFRFLYFLLEKLLVFEQALRHAVVCEGRLELAPRLKKWHHYHVDVAELELERIASGTVEEGRDCEVEFSLQVALLVVFLHFVCEPFEVNNRKFARVAVVARVQTHVKNKLFVLVVVLRELLGGKSALKLHCKFKN